MRNKALRQGQGRAGRGQEGSKREGEGKNSLTRGKLTRELWTVFVFVCVCVCMCMCMCVWERVRERGKVHVCACVCRRPLARSLCVPLNFALCFTSLTFLLYFFSFTWGCIHKNFEQLFLLIKRNDTENLFYSVKLITKRELYYKESVLLLRLLALLWPSLLEGIHDNFEQLLGEVLLVLFFHHLHL